MSVRDTYTQLVVEREDTSHGEWLRIEAVKMISYAVVVESLERLVT